MNDWLLLGLSNAILASIIAVPAYLVSRTGKSPTLAHALWVLVLIKLVTPPFVPIPVLQIADEPNAIRSMTTSEEETSTASNTDPEPIASESDETLALNMPHRVFSFELELPQPDHQQAETNRQKSSATAQTETSKIDESIASKSSDDSSRTKSQGLLFGAIPTISPELILLIVWGLGSSIFFGRVFLQLRRFRMILNASQPANEDVTDFVKRLSNKIGLRKSPEVRLVPGSISPMVFTIGHSTQLIVPKDLSGWLKDNEQLETLITHELAHLKRRDHWVRHLELLVCGLYWWLPTVWLAKRGIREVEEEVCDAWVVNTLPSANRSYAEALLNTADFLSGSRTSLPPTGSAISHFRFIQRRIRMIMKGSVSTKLDWTGRLVVLMVAGAFLPMSFGTATTSQAAIRELPKELNAEATLNVIAQDDDDDDDDDESDLDEIRQEVLDELISEFGEFDDDIEEAIEEVREELLEELKDAPPLVQKIIAEMDIDGMLDEVLEDAPGPVRTFVDMVDVEEIIEEALEDADLDEIDLSDGQASIMRQMLNQELGKQLKNASNELTRELAQAQEEIERAMKNAPPEVRAVLEDADLDELLENILDDSSPLVREIIEEIGVEDLIEKHTRRDDDDDADDDADDEDADDDDADDDDDDEDREEIEERLERRLEQLLKEAEAIRAELNELRRERRRRR